MRLRQIVSYLVLSLCLWIVPLSAQEADGAGGVWVSAGVGGGASTSDEFTGSEHWGGSFYARVGGTVSPAFRLGGEFMVWGRKHENDLSPARGNLTLAALYHPGGSDVAFLKASAGLAVGALLRPHPGGVTTRGATGFGATGGVGALVRLGNHVFLTPNLDVLFQHFPTSDDPSLTNFVILFNLGLTFR